MFMTYRPFFINPQIETDVPGNQVRHDDSSRLKRIMRWLRSHIFRIHIYRLPYGRRSLEAQLQSRTTEPRSEWESANIPYESARPILQAIAHALNLPNGHYLPSDPVILAIITDYDVFPSLSIRDALEDALGHDVDHDELCATLDDDATMESVVRYLIRSDSA